MNDALFFLIKSVLGSAIFYGFYKLWMSREPTLKLNRFYLLSAAVLSALLPFLGTYVAGNSVLQSQSQGLAILTLPLVTIESTPLLQATGESTLMSWTVAGYFIGVLVIAMSLCISIFRLVKLLQNANQSILLSNNVYIIESGTPFSFMRNIFVPRKYMNHPALSSIISHEKAHIRQLHSIDTLLMELLCGILWFNPFVYLMRRELREVHEYLADREVIESGIDIIEYQKVLLAEAISGNPLRITHNFSFNLKNRIIMLLKKNNHTGMKYTLAVLPLLCLAIIALSFVQPEKTQASEAKNYNASETSNLQIPDTTIKSAYSTPQTDNDQIFMVVENPPSFPGGEKARMAYMAKNITYPIQAKENWIQGTVYVSFVVEKDGSVSNVKILRGIGGGCDEEAIRVIENMPNWKPGTQRDQPRRVQFNTPIQFTLGKGTKQK